MKNTKLIFSIALIVIIFAIKPIADWVSDQWNVDLSLVVEQRRNFVIVALAWFLIILLRRIKRQVLKHYDITKEDNLKSRKLLFNSHK